MFTKACRYIFKINGEPAIITRFDFGQEEGLPDALSIPVSDSELIHLESYNLLSVDPIDRNFYQGSMETMNKGSEDTLEYFDTEFKVSWDQELRSAAGTETIRKHRNVLLGCASLSTIGRELYPISGATADHEFEQAIVDGLNNTVHLRLDVRKPV